MFLIVLAYAIVASTFPIAKDSVLYAKPIFLIAFRMILAGAAMLSYLLLTKKNELLIKKNDLVRFFRVSCTHVYIAFICEFWALSQPSIQSSKVNIIYSATPFIAAILAYYLLGETLTRRKWIGLTLGVIGLAPIIVLQSDPMAGGELLRISLPELALLVAVTSASYAWFDIKVLMSRHYSLFSINGYAMLLGGLGALVTSLMVEGNPAYSVFNTSSFLFYVGLLIILSNVIFYNLYGYLLQNYSITFLTFAGFLSPLFGSFFGWMRGETLTWHYFASLSLITCALYVFSRDEKKKSSVMVEPS